MPVILSFLVLFVQVQHKLNRVATSSGSANPLVAMSALLRVMADALIKSAGRQDAEKVRQHFASRRRNVFVSRGRARLT